MSVDNEDTAHSADGSATADQAGRHGDRLAGIRNLPAWEEPEAFVGSVGRTMFDAPGAKDNSLTVLLPFDSVQRMPAQSLVRIVSHPDNREYLGIVVAGPFAEPDGLRADAPALVTTAVQGATFMPRYHGRVQVELLGERNPEGTLMPPRLRPLPNSPVFVLDNEATADVLQVAGTLQLGVTVGDEEIEVKIDGAKKAVLPRHTGVLGTTGGGKSTTVSRIIEQAVATGWAVLLFDTEGEYTELNQPTEDRTMLAALRRRGLSPHGVSNTVLYRLVGKETTNPDHPDVRDFSLRFASLSPYVVEELLDLNDAQKDRFDKAYDATKLLLRDLGVFPENKDGRVDPQQDREAFELNEFETGYPHMRLDHLIDVAQMIHDKVSKVEVSPRFATEFRTAWTDSKIKPMVSQRIEVAAAATSSAFSWRALLGRLYRLRRLGIFDVAKVPPPNYEELLTPGRLSIFDLSDTDSPEVNNLVIADLLRGTQRQQDDSYQAVAMGTGHLVKTLIVIEEAHEFLSEERIMAMPNLFQQVSRIAKRGRKRWLSLMFVTQLPQHLPRQVLGLVNNFVLHKINDVVTINRLKGSIAGIDEGLWTRLPGLAPGQAIVSFASMARPLLVAVDPTPARLRMID
jgi:DNA helicase HerA-like ATPase